MHPYKDKAKNGKQLAKKRGYADGGGVGDVLAESLKPFGLIKMIGKGLGIGDDENDKSAANFVPKGAISDNDKKTGVMGRKSGGKVNKKGC